MANGGFIASLPKWAWLWLALACGIGAAFMFVVYMANGIVTGDLIGLPGRERDMIVAQHRSLVGLISCTVLQFGVAGALFGYLNKDHGRVGAMIFSVLVSPTVTFVCALALLFALRVFH